MSDQVKTSTSQEGREHHEDNLAHPCIFLIRHSLESFLKYYLVCLVNYNQRHPFFVMKANWEKVFLTEHRLKVIADLIWKIVSPPGIFQNSNFRKCLDFFSKFDEIDNNSTAFRYSTDAKGKAQRLHQDQWYVDVLLFLKYVDEIRLDIMSFTEGWIYLFEDYGYFNDSTLNYIENSLRKFRDFDNYLKSNKFESHQTEKESGIESLAGALLARTDKFTAYLGWKKKFCESVEAHFSEDDLIEACEGMYFGRDGYITRPSSKKHAIDKLLEKNHSFDEFLAKSETHLKHIRHFKKIKAESAIFEVV